MPSAAYDRAVAEAAAHHQRSKTYSGKFLRPHKPFIAEIAARRGVATMLDYGCGKGQQYEWIDPADGLTLEQAWGVDLTKHDPAWPPFAAEPVGPFDMVICTHVLGSIPCEDLDWAFERIFGFATKAVYLAEKLGPVRKKALSDPDLRPVGWTMKQWLRTARPWAQAFAKHGGETHFSFRELTDEGVQTQRGVWRAK